jgi:hypothetical protein
MCSSNYKSYLVHSFSENLVGAGRLLLIHQTRGKRVGNKKRPQVDSCDPLKQKAKQEQQTQLQSSKDLNGVQGEFLGRG